MHTKHAEAISKYKYTTTKEWIDAVGETSLQGQITTSRRVLEQLFGEPFEYNDDEPYWDGKVTTEWIIIFDDGVIATIYDWKRDEQGPPALDEQYTWHIGAHKDTDAVDRIHYLTPPF